MSEVEYLARINTLLSIENMSPTERIRFLAENLAQVGPDSALGRRIASILQTGTEGRGEEMLDVLKACCGRIQ